MIQFLNSNVYFRVIHLFLKLLKHFKASLKLSNSNNVNLKFHIFSKVLFKILFLILFLPLCILCIGPIYVIRLGVLGLSKFLRPDLVSILGVRNMFYAVDDITSNPKSTVVATAICKGKIPREDLVKNIEEALTKRCSDSKKLLYPELKRYLVKWLGFIFWKEEKNFNVEKHVVYINPHQYIFQPFKKLDEDVLKQIENTLVQEPFAQETSPWSLHILENYYSNELMQTRLDSNENTEEGHEFSVVLFKVHHSFADGFSIMNLLLNDVMKCPTKELSMPNFPKRSCLQKIALNLFLILKAPYDTVSEALMDNDQNSWYLKKERVTNIIHSATSPRIPTCKIKEIAKNTNGSFTGVVISAISGGIRSFMIERGENVNSKSSFTCMAPFPVPGHPETLGNYLSDCYVEFPIGIVDSIKRLRHVERQLEEIKYSTLSLSSFVMQPVFGGLFHWMVKPLVEFAMSKSTGVFSSFPCPRVECKGPGGTVAFDIYFSAGHDSPGVGIQFLAINYNGGWKLKIQADHATLSSDTEVERLLILVIQELDNLEIDTAF